MTTAAEPSAAGPWIKWRPPLAHAVMAWDRVPWPYGPFGLLGSTLKLPGIFRAPASTPVSFSAIEYAGSVAVGLGQGPRS